MEMSGEDEDVNDAEDEQEEDPRRIVSRSRQDQYILVVRFDLLLRVRYPVQNIHAYIHTHRTYIF